MKLIIGSLTVLQTVRSFPDDSKQIHMREYNHEIPLSHSC